MDRSPPKAKPKPSAPIEHRAPSVPPAEIALTLTLASRVISELEKNDLYASIDLDPAASAVEIRATLSRLRMLFAGASRCVSAPGEAGRIVTAGLSLDRIEMTLADPIRRLEFDLRKGHLRPEERIADAKRRSGIPLVKIWELWSQIHPGAIERAANLRRRAFEAKKVRLFEAAVEAAHAALALNPFIEDLRGVLPEWEVLAQRQRS